MHSFLKSIAYTSLACFMCFSASADEHGHEHEDTPLAEEMSAMGKPFKMLSRTFKKTPDPAKNAEYVAWAETFLKHTKLSAQYTPALVEKLEPAEQKKMEAAYQVAIKESVKTAEQLVVALKAEDYATAKKLLADLNSQKKKGHSKFQEDED
ncbi:MULTISPECIES: cytochrome b562 [unclassified Lentimonas]|uniref:cytochrome b562 n=1 Tax=unclassified Lentimonas TaxID=2630993 RepID=UPI00132A3D69|nr:MULTISPECIES: cytochrome b562 [unclassified Lentimonas]CAA6679733.1 Unannotated [Lentimonas sp. CC4]CAA6683501.1 Unannotated [Lentimonas sp. CC6]CAA7077262.1 Unannotated [Lentimonas sp. CC4]CAA7171404.1 Unannotated [Lentimonas sp. CC21]CAA7182389.1 Unannotated [Lentimonas sp. CC8]